MKLGWIFFCLLSPSLAWSRQTDLPFSYGTNMVQTLSSLGRKTKAIKSDTFLKVIQGAEQKHLQLTAPQNSTVSFWHHNTPGFHYKRNQHSTYITVVSRLLPDKTKGLQDLSLPWPGTNHVTNGRGQTFRCLGTVISWLQRLLRWQWQGEGRKVFLKFT